MENFLRSKEYWELVEPGYVEPANVSLQTEAQLKKNDKIKLQDLKLKNYLFQSIDRTIFETILKKNTAKNYGMLWRKSMKEIQESSGLIFKLFVEILKFLRWSLVKGSQSTSLGS